MVYMSEVVASMMTTIFMIFVIGTVGYLIGGISVKGISLGTAGVLLVALIFGVVSSYIPSFNLGDHVINLYNDTNKSLFSLVSSMGTALFVTAVGLIAGPKFFRTFNKKSMSYICLGFIIIIVGVVTAIVLMKIFNVEAEMMVGLMTGALTTTPGLSAATEAAVQFGKSQELITAGYGIAYLFGILGVVLFVQIMPKLLKVDIAEENKKFTQINAVNIKADGKKRYAVEDMGLFPFFLAVALGVIIGSFYIPGINFSLGTSGGTLIAGLIVGHFGHIGPIDCKVPKSTLNLMRELGLVLFLIGAGVPGGVRFISNVKLEYFLYGIVLTMVPMVIGFLIAKYVFKLSIFNNLGSITGGMTSTPALGTLISVTGTDDVASAYAATYPFALVSIVIAAKLIIQLM